MKKIFIFIICFVLIASLVGCDWDEFFTTSTTTNASITASTTSTTSTTTTTSTATTTIPQVDPAEIDTLEDIMQNISYDYATYSFYSANLAYNDKISYELDFDQFWKDFAVKKDQLLVPYDDTTRYKVSEVYEYAKFPDKLTDGFIMVVSLYNHDYCVIVDGQKIPFPIVSFYIYYNGFADIHTNFGHFITVNEGAFDWDAILKDYLYWGV